MKTTSPSFKPPFCPRPSCQHHCDASAWKPVKDGQHYNRALGRLIQRYRCKDCGRAFSSQTFDTTYWLKKPHLLEKIFNASVACSGLRQIADMHGVAHSTVARHCARLGRHCLLYHQLKRPKVPPNEELVLDGFMTFEYSQFWPFELNTLVGARSSFIHGFTESALRRSGSMTDEQKAKRAELEARHGRPDPKATVNAVERVLRTAAPEPVELVLRSDEHRAYPRALERLPHLKVEHQTTHSKKPRTPFNPLFPVNLLHLLIRHRGANHKRETIAQSKRRQCAVERLAIMQVQRNYLKSRTVAQPKGPSPAELVGVMKQKPSLGKLLERRLLPSQFELPPEVETYYAGRLETRQVPNGRKHELSYAY